MLKICTLLIFLFVIISLKSKAQDNYEIQVYGSETVDSAYTMVELHSNYTFDGSNTVTDDVLPTNHVKVSYNITKVGAIGPEYYAGNGPFFKYDPWQQQQLFMATDLNFNPNWEFNAGYGRGFTDGTDRSIFKVILGRRI